MGNQGDDHSDLTDSYDLALVQQIMRMIGRYDMTQKDLQGLEMGLEHLAA